MSKSKHLHTSEEDWKGITYVLEFFESDDLSNLNPATQAQAVCFTDDGKIILYEHTDGWFGLPGGTIEKGESPEEALQREVAEESSAHITEFGPIGYLRTYEKNTPDKVSFQLRYWAKAELLPETPDPDGKALKRILINPSEAAKKLNWGKRGEILIELALQKHENTSN